MHTVTLQVAVHIGDAEERAEEPQEDRRAVSQTAAPREVTNALAVFWSSRRREAGKMERLSPMRPRATSRVVGKARFNWTPTRDLVRPWPVSIFVWGALVVGVLSGLAALGYARAFSPAPISDAHARSSLQARPAIAREPNAHSCTTCHTMRASMESRCASCHEAEAFARLSLSRTTEAGNRLRHLSHRASGRGFQPDGRGPSNRNECHTDANPKLYRAAASARRTAELRLSCPRRRVGLGGVVRG